MARRENANTKSLYEVQMHREKFVEMETFV